MSTNNMVINRVPEHVVKICIKIIDNNIYIYVDVYIKIECISESICVWELLYIYKSCDIYIKKCVFVICYNHNNNINFMFPTVVNYFTTCIYNQ